MKTADEILTEVMNESPYNAKFPLTRPYIIDAMERYVTQKQKKLIKKLENENANRKNYLEVNDISKDLRRRINHKYNYTSEIIQQLKNCL